MSTLRQSIGEALRAARICKPMSQQELAAAVGISRTTLVQLEKGSDAQTSSVEKTSHALGVEFGILEESAAMARRRTARSKLQAKLAVSREKHLKIAVKFALGGPDAAALKSGALKMVKLWREKQLCSPVYIDRWQQILDAKPQQVPKAYWRWTSMNGGLLCARTRRLPWPFHED